jgi:hypothetical protein
LETVSKRAVYRPLGPYFFKTGQRAGECLEVLMFKDYAFLVWLLSRLNNNQRGERKNELHQHLEWLLKRGEEITPKAVCPYCKEYPVRFFSVIYTGNDFSVSSSYTCCEKEECMNAVVSMGLGKRVSFYPVKFSSLLRFSKKDRKRIVNLFKDILEIKKLTPQSAFRIFAE